MAYFSWLVGPWGVVVAWWRHTALPFLKRNWLWIVNGFFVLLGLFFVAEKFTPRKIVRPTLPAPDQEKRDQAVAAEKEAHQKVVDVVDRTKANNEHHQQKVDKVEATPSKDVDDAIDKWNRGE